MIHKSCHWNLKHKPKKINKYHFNFWFNTDNNTQNTPNLKLTITDCFVYVSLFIQVRSTTLAFAYESAEYINFLIAV